MTPKLFFKQALRKSGLWDVLKFSLPRYHRPALRLACAKMREWREPSAPNKKSLASAYLAWADVQAYQDAWPEVAAVCEKALTVDPSCGEARARRDEVLLRLGRLLMRNVHDQTSSNKSLELIKAAAARFEAVLDAPKASTPAQSEAREELAHCYALLGRWDDIERLNRPV